MQNNLNYEICDAHNHIFPDKIALKATEAIGKFYDIPMKYCGDSENLLESASKAGITKMLVCSVATVPAQTEVINSYIKSECDKHKEFLGFGSIHPDNENLSDIVDDIYNKGLFGIKIHSDFQHFDIDDKKAYPIYEAAEGRLPILFHMGDDRYDYSKPHRLANILKDFPKLTVIAAHFGGYRCWEEAKQCLVGKDNVMFDTSSTLGMNNIEYSKKLIKKFDIDRLMFGTDFPMWDHSEELKRFLSLGLSDYDNKKILRDNFIHFFNL